MLSIDQIHQDDFNWMIFSLIEIHERLHDEGASEQEIADVNRVIDFLINYRDSRWPSADKA